MQGQREKTYLASVVGLMLAAILLLPATQAFGDPKSDADATIAKLDGDMARLKADEAKLREDLKKAEEAKAAAEKNKNEAEAKKQEEEMKRLREELVKNMMSQMQNMMDRQQAMNARNAATRDSGGGGGQQGGGGGGEKGGGGGGGEEKGQGGGGQQGGGQQGGGDKGGGNNQQQPQQNQQTKLPEYEKPEKTEDDNKDDDQFVNLVKELLNDKDEETKETTTASTGTSADAFNKQMAELAKQRAEIVAQAMKGIQPAGAGNVQTAGNTNGQGQGGTAQGATAPQNSFVSRITGNSPRTTIPDRVDLRNDPTLNRAIQNGNPFDYSIAQGRIDASLRNTGGGVSTISDGSSDTGSVATTGGSTSGGSTSGRTTTSVLGATADHVPGTVYLPAGGDSLVGRAMLPPDLVDLMGDRESLIMGSTRGVRNRIPGTSTLKASTR